MFVYIAILLFSMQCVEVYLAFSFINNLHAHDIKYYSASIIVCDDRLYMSRSNSVLFCSGDIKDFDFRC